MFSIRSRKRSVCSRAGVAVFGLMLAAAFFPLHVPAQTAPAEALAEGELVAAEDARMAEDEVGAFLGYASLLDAYPGTAAAQTARTRHGEMLGQWIAAGAVSPELEAAAAALAAQPLAESQCSVAEKVLRMHCHGLKAHFAGATGNEVEHREQMGLARQAAWAVLRENPDSPLTEMAMESLLGATLSLKDADAVELDAVQAVMHRQWPRMSPVAKNVALQVCSYYAHDQLGREGKEAAAPRFETLREASWKAMLEHPEDAPLQVNATGFYVAAAMQLPDAERHAAYDRLAALVEEHEPCVMTWFGRYELATVTAWEPMTEEEARQVYRHHEIILAEMDRGYMDQVLNDPAVDERTKGMLVAMLGHAYAGTNQLDRALEHYGFVLENYGGHIHARELAEYSQVAIGNARAGVSPAQAAANFDRYVADHPDSSFLGEALLNAGQRLEIAGNAAGARARYERVSADRPHTPEAERAQANASRLAAQQ